MPVPPTATETNPPDPHQDRPAAVAVAPSRTGRLLGVVRKLIAFGKGLASTLQQRAASATSIAAITERFGTNDIAAIVAHITRGLQRAALLEARLISRRERRTAAAPPPAVARSVIQLRATQPADRRANRAGSHLADLPSVQDIAAQVRRLPVGVVIADICRDLCIVPSDPLWRELALVITEYGGNLAVLLRDTFKRVYRAGAEPLAVASPASPAPILLLPAPSGADPP